MFLYRYSGGLVAPADTNTGLNFVTHENVGPLPDDEEPLRGQLEPRPVSGPLTAVTVLNYSHRGVVFPCRSTPSAGDGDWKSREATEHRGRSRKYGTKEGKRVKGFVGRGLILVLGVADPALAVSAGAVASTKKKSARQRAGLRAPAGHAVVGPLGSSSTSRC